MIYFVLTDRFADGDSSNNDMGKGEFDPKRLESYHGGDFAGLIQKLDYIEDLGAGAVWVTPPVANQWVSPSYGGLRYMGYHGYWAQDLYDVDAHLGGMEAYKDFIRQAHARGIAVIQDIVCNHLGDFSSSDGKNSRQGGYPEHPAAPFTDQSIEGGLFHFNGNSTYTREYANLDDLNTENPQVIQALIDVYKFWIREADVDGFRVDTASSVPMEFWRVFVPQIVAYAKSLGKDNFIVFGEDYEYDQCVQLRFDGADKGQARYTGTAEAPVFNGMLNFAFCGAATSVFSGSLINGRGWNPPTPRFGSFAQLDGRFSPEIRALYAGKSADQLVNFLDNHDMMRINAPDKIGGDSGALKLAIGALLTLPGIPCMLYGTEQGFDEPAPIPGGQTNRRQDLWDSGYETSNPFYTWTARLNALRRAYPALSRGSYVSRIIDGNEGAAYSFSRILDGQEVLVVMNRSTDIQWIKPITGIKEDLIDSLNPGKPIKKGSRIKIKPQTMMVLVGKSMWKADALTLR